MRFSFFIQKKKKINYIIQITGNKPLIWIESSSSSSFQSTVVKAFDCIDGEISNKVECHESDGLKCFVENSQQIGSQIVIEQKNLKKGFILLLLLN